MKAKSTIEKQIRRLKRIADMEDVPEWLRHGAYESYHALRWVVEDTDWTPAGTAEAYLEETAETEGW